MGAWRFAALGLTLTLSAQTSAVFAPVTDMPPERVADSYAIYLRVLPSDAIEWSGVSRTQWLLQDVTTAKPITTACDQSQMTDLPEAVHPPTERKAEWDEVLTDFAVHCHDRYRLDSAGFKLALPLRLLDEDSQSRYWRGVSGYMPQKNNIMQAPATPDEFKGAAGLHSFSAVYFNRSHTLAATYFGMGCGSLCGNWKWVVLEKKDGVWKRLDWVTVVTFS